MNRQAKKIFIITLVIPIIFLSGCTGEIQPLTSTETTAPTITETVAPTVTNTRQPTHTPTQAPTATPTATVEPADGTPEKYLQILNEIYEYYENTMPSAATRPVNADDFLSPDGRYLVLQYIADADTLMLPVFDIQENQYMDIPIKFTENVYEMISMDSWSANGSTIFMGLSPQVGLKSDTSLLIIQSFDERIFDEYVFPYPEDTYGMPFILGQDDNHLIFMESTDFFVTNIDTNQTLKYSLPEEIYLRSIFYFEGTNYLVGCFLNQAQGIWNSEMRVVLGSTGESEVVFSTTRKVEIVDYDPDRNLVLLRTDEDQFIFLDTETWVETTFLEEDALFGQETKLIGNCIPSNFESEDGGLRAGLYNLITGEIEILGDISYIGWYPLFKNHLVVVNNGEGDYWIEFLDVVCE